MADNDASRATRFVERIFRDDGGRVLATLIRVLRDFDLAEEVAQEAFAAATEQWPRDGVPQNPSAWLVGVARKKAIDRIRRRALHGQKIAEIDVEASYAIDDERGVEDDRLRLVFTCCHPALPIEAQVALTLRTLCGLTTEEIAHAFLVPAATMAQRLVRAKTKIRDAGIPYRVPDADVLGERLDAVLAVVYLVFTEGYAASSGDALVRRDLSAEAIRLARLVVELMPEHVEARALLALLLLHDSRRDARVDASGDVVLLEDQDRSKWDRAAIDEGLGLVERALRETRGRPGPYALQAAIAGVHAQAARAEDTDWPQIAALYRVLARVAPSPIVELNRAVAVAMVDGPEAALAIVDALTSLADYHLFHAARADLLRRAARPAEALAAYRRARDLAPNDAERRYLDRRIGELA